MFGGRQQNRIMRHQSRCHRICTNTGSSIFKDLQRHSVRGVVGKCTGRKPLRDPSTRRNLQRYVGGQHSRPGGKFDHVDLYPTHEWKHTVILHVAILGHGAAAATAA